MAKKLWVNFGCPFLALKFKCINRAYEISVQNIGQSLKIQYSVKKLMNFNFLFDLFDSSDFEAYKNQQENEFWSQFSPNFSWINMGLRYISYFLILTIHIWNSSKMSHLNFRAKNFLLYRKIFGVKNYMFRFSRQKLLKLSQ